MRISDWSSDVCSSDLQVGQHIFEGEADRGDEFERPRGHGVVKEGTRHRGVPDPVTTVEEGMEAIVIFVVVRCGMNMGLRMHDFVPRLHLASDLGAAPFKLATDPSDHLLRGLLNQANHLYAYIHYCVIN